MVGNIFFYLCCNFGRRIFKNFEIGARTVYLAFEDEKMLCDQNFLSKIVLYFLISECRFYCNFFLDTDSFNSVKHCLIGNFFVFM